MIKSSPGPPCLARRPSPFTHFPTIWLISWGPSALTLIPLVRLMAIVPGLTCKGEGPEGFNHCPKEGLHSFQSGHISLFKCGQHLMYPTHYASGPTHASSQIPHPINHHMPCSTPHPTPQHPIHLSPCRRPAAACRSLGQTGEARR